MIWSDIQAFLQKAITQEINAIVQTDTDQRICISTTKLKQTTEPRLIAFEMLRKYNFNADTVAQLMQSIDKKESGKRFLSKSHEAIIDREHIIISPKASLENPTTYTFEHLNASFPEWLQLTHGNIDANFQIKRDRHIATFDADAIQWPLTLRHWQEGDCFKPFGMQGMQKVSDLLINNKIDCQNKKKIWILCDATKILWVVGIRTDGRAAITNKSKQYIEFHTLQ